VRASIPLPHSGSRGVKYGFQKRRGRHIILSFLLMRIRWKGILIAGLLNRKKEGEEEETGKKGGLRLLLSPVRAREEEKKSRHPRIGGKKRKSAFFTNVRGGGRDFSTMEEKRGRTCPSSYGVEKREEKRIQEKGEDILFSS